MGRKKVAPKKVVRKKSSKNDQTNFLIGFLLVCISLFVIIIVSKTLPAVVLSPTSYKENFASGQQVIWYDDSGIFMYDAALENNVALVNFPLLQTSLNPLLSPDNKKIAYLMQTTNYPNAKFGLWVYDLTTKKNTVLIKDFKSSSHAPYTWAEDSHSLFVVLLSENKHRLFRVTLEGKKTLLTADYSGDVYANLSGPDVINERFVAFSTCENDCEKKIGIVDSNRKKTFFINAPEGADKTKILSHDDTHALLANIYELPKAQVDEAQRIENNNNVIGLNKISLTTQKVENVPLPKENTLHENQRMQVAGLCGDSVLVGLVGVRDRDGYQEEYYTRYFLYNIQEQKLIRFDDSWGCDKQGQIYATESNIHEPLAIKQIDITNILENKEIKYSGLLSEEMLSEIRKGCLGIGMLATGSNNGRDFVYIDVGTYLDAQAFGQYEALCQQDVIAKLSGIYRLSGAEKKVVKLNKGYPTYHRFSLIEPNP